MKVEYQDIDDYISQQPLQVQDQLQQLRLLIRKLAPEATEHISYGMPTFKIVKVLAHFGVQKTHIGFYPGPKPIEHYKVQLRAYSISKGTVRFEIGKPLPLEIISEMINFKIKQLYK
ncbi:MAG: hypothetical protein HKN68_14850 [Saprospiraceae bacterium]|nr:hypothetical protein [Saprospiraceae bacterium]